jgi:hypothetical protein
MAALKPDLSRFHAEHFGRLSMNSVEVAGFAREAFFVLKKLERELHLFSSRGTFYFLLDMKKEKGNLQHGK